MGQSIWVVSAAIALVVGFYLVRWGVLDGLIQRRIRIKFSQRVATGREAVGWGAFSIALGLVVLGVGCWMLNQAFRP